MTGCSLIHHRPSHSRVISDPPIPHPTVLNLDENLHNLKSTLNSSSSPNAQILCNAVKEVANLYSSIDELLCFQSHHRKWIEEQLDASIKLLELISSTKDLMVLMKEHVQDLRLTNRRKGNNACETSHKKLHRETKVCLRLLKLVESSACSINVRDWDLMRVDRILIKMKDILVALFRSLMCLLSVPRPRIRRGLLTKEGSEDQQHLGELEQSIEGFEDGLELLFRKLIQNRVTLLNVLSLYQETFNAHNELYKT